MTEQLTGSCMCGETTLTVTPAEKHVHACHCGMCRRWTGSAFMGFETVPGSVTHKGPVRTRQTSDWAERAWCDSCGSALWYKVTAEGPGFGVQYVAAGLFDGAGDYALEGELFIDRKPAGYAFAGDHKKMTETEVMALFEPDEGDTA
ncbi:GFA family protein [Rhodobacteraceae bacterium NNCM2]|nr:GFA family protein [Coraliihabitans acroporae]